VTTLNEELVSKRVELLHEAIPTTTSIALLVNRTSPNLAEAAINDAGTAIRRYGLTLNVLEASTERDFDTVFATLTQPQAGALVITTDAFFISKGEQLGALALRYRPFVAAGGLMSYGTPIHKRLFDHLVGAAKERDRECDAEGLGETYSLAGVYTGRILKGERPDGLPVQQVSKIELIINTKSAVTPFVCVR
jgi:putative ABC transport system substrate-binding protein